MQLTINNISYTDRFSSLAKLIENIKSKEGQTFEFISQDDLDKRSYSISSRNPSGAYILPTENEKVYINYIPQKVVVSDGDIMDMIGSNFTYFAPEVLPTTEPFTLGEGQIFRCVSANSVPMPKEDYIYYIIVDGQKKRIPNYKSLEVMLAERNLTLLSVRVITESQCDDIPDSIDPIPDKQSQWQPAFEDQTNVEKLKSLENSVKTGEQLAAGATASANQQIAAVKAAEEKAKAEAQASEAKAKAAESASKAAIAQAEAEKAAAEQARAALELEKANLNK